MLKRSKLLSTRLVILIAIAWILPLGSSVLMANAKGILPILYFPLLDSDTCQISEVEISFFPETGTKISLGDRVGFTINSSSICSGLDITVSITILNASGNLLSGLGGFERLNGSGSTTFYYEVSRYDVHQGNEHSIEARITTYEMEELIGEQSWELDINSASILPSIMLLLTD